MTGLKTVPCQIAGMGLVIVLLEDEIVSNSLINRQDMSRHFSMSIFRK